MTLRYDKETLLKAQKQFELAAAIMELAVTEHGDPEKEDDFGRHIIQSCEVAKEGVDLI